jgi:solute carrier family 8 (sodium/calcium exchanger)
MPECDSGEEHGTIDYILHFLSFYWKLLLAFIPPTKYCGGWAAFFASLTVTGIMTAIVGDLASMFGCIVGLKKSVTAITFIALGTSIPDTFASKLAAQNDPYADASIGNITGSNSVNVFLGLGLPWTLSSIYHAA